ncbi:hypothetical protein OAD88_06700 [Flavobacteriaceae bacterium]|nr:hypothetical protein [Flavobacteriaceae bacterium]
MKNILFLLLFITATVTAQNTRGKANDAGRIVLNTFIEDLEGVPAGALKMLKTKITQMASKNGMGGSESFPRFVMSADIDILTQDITPTAPPKTALTLGVTLYIGDGIEGTVFATEYIELKGIGNNETKAYIQSFRALSPRNKKFNEFIETGKKKIIEYYNSRCDFILKEANTLADQKDFDKSITKLIEVPEVCKDCYDKAMDLSSTIFKRKMENECQENMSKSNSLIAQDKWEEAANPIAGYTPDMACYPDVKSLFTKIGNHKCSVSLGKAKGAWAKRDSKSSASALSEISFDSSCYQEGMKLFKSISSALDAKAKQEWDLKYEKYNRDQTIKEVVAETNRLDANSQRGINELNSETQRKINSLDAESRRKVQEEMVNVEKRRIEAFRQIGVAAAENQPRIKYKLLKN